MAGTGSERVKWVSLEQVGTSYLKVEAIKGPSNVCQLYVKNIATKRGKRLVRFQTVLQ